MDAQLKAKWVEALRSGEYKQGDAELYNCKDGSYCCLGVLCRVAGIEIDNQRDIAAGGESGDVTARYAPLKAIIGVSDLYQLTSRNDGGYHPSLNEKHDPHTFEQLADYIEAHL